MGDDQFGGRRGAVGGTQPTAEAAPDGLGMEDGQVLKQPLDDEANLDVPLIGLQFAPDLRPVAVGLAVEVLVALAPADGSHGLHPEMAGIGADGVDGLLEADLNFKAPPVELDDGEGSEGEVRAQEDELTPSRVIDRHQADSPAQGTPEQIQATVTELNAPFAIDRAGGRAERVALLEQGVEFDFLALAPRATTTALGVGFGGFRGGGGAAQPADQVVASVQERESDFAAGVIGVGHQVEGLFQAQVQEESDQLVQQGAAPTVGEDQALVNATGQRHGHAAAQRLHQQGNGLARVAHDEVRLGIAGRLLVETFDPRHLAALLGRFEAIGQPDQARADAHQAPGKAADHQGGPGADEFGQIEGGRVKEVKEAVLAAGPEPVAADQAGDPSQVGPNAESG